MSEVQDEQREQVDEEKVEREAEAEAAAEVGEEALNLDAKNPRAAQLGAGGGPAPASGPTYTAVEGDTLSGLAQRFLGASSRWPEIHQLNKSAISDPDLILVGQDIRLPPEADVDAATDKKASASGEAKEKGGAGGGGAGAAGAAAAGAVLAGAGAASPSMGKAGVKETEEDKKGPGGKAPSEEDAKKREEEEKAAEKAKNAPPPTDGIPQVEKGQKAEKGGEEKAEKKAKGDEDAGGKKGGGEKKAGGADKGAGQKVEEGGKKEGEGKAEEGTAPAGDAPIPRLDAAEGQNATVDPPIPSSFQQTEQLVDAGAAVQAEDPDVQPENAKKQGFGEVVRDSLLVGTLGPLYPTLFFDKNIASIPDKLSKSWDGFGEGGWQTAYAAINGVYSIVDIITSITGPVGSALSILGYSRYIPIPPVAAFGAWATTIGKVLQGITFILDIVKLVLGALKIVVGACAAAFAKDPKIRKKFAEGLLGDTLQFVGNGISVGVGAATSGEFRGGWSSARQAGKGVLGATKTGFTAMSRGPVRNAMAPFRSGGMSRAFGETVSETTGIAKPLVREFGADTTLDAFAGGSRNARTYLARQGGSALLKDLSGRPASIATTVASKGVEEPARSADEGGPGMTTSDIPLIGEPLVGSMESGGARDAATIAALSTAPGSILSAPVVAGGGIADWLESESTASIEEVSAQAAASPKKLTTAPYPPEKVATAPMQREPVDKQKTEMQKQAKDLEEQKIAAKAGQEEAAGISKAAEEHKAKAEKSAAGADKGKAQTAKDQAGVAQDKQKVKKGKAESQKGKSKFGEAEGKGGEGKGGAPADASSDDVPWYKKPFAWVISKINAGKRKLTGLLTKMIMKAISGATGMDDMDGKLEEADAHVGEQEQTLAEEPGKFGQMSEAFTKEAGEASKVKAEAEARKAKNQAVEQKAEKNLQETKAQEQKLAQEEKKIEGDAAEYEGTYGPAYDEMKELAGKQEEKDFTPMELTLDKQVAVIQQGASKLRGSMDEHQAEMAAGADERKGAIVDEIGSREDAGGGAAGEAAERGETVKGNVLSKSEEGDAQRRSRVDAIESEAGALQGEKASKEAVEKVAKLQGKLVAEARGFEGDRQTEMQVMHDSFSQAYAGMVGLGEAA